MSMESLYVFIAIAFFYIIIPGPSIVLAITNGLSSNMRTVVVSSLGHISGLFISASITSLGIGVLIVNSQFLFASVKILGALYIIYLGIKQFKISKGISIYNINDVQVSQSKHIFSFYKEAFLLSILNPKPLVFFIAVFPQFMNNGTDVFIRVFTMTFIFMFISFTSLLIYGLLANFSKKLFTSTLIMEIFYQSVSFLFIGLGSLMILMEFSRW